MQKYLSLLIFLLLVVGCSGQTNTIINPTTATQAAGATSSGMVTPATPTATPGAKQALPTDASVPSNPEANSTAAPSNPDANPTAASTSGIEQSNGSLSVKIFSDAEVEVNQSQYQIAGSAPAGTVISINDDVIVVDKSQMFTDLVSLDEGPNLIEIVASDDAGQEVTLQLTVTYNP